MLVGQLGIIIDDDKLRRIAAIDDKWDAFATTLSSRVKSAILTVVSDFDQLLDRMNKIEDQQDINVQIKLKGVYDERDSVKSQISELESTLNAGGLTRCRR